MGLEDLDVEVKEAAAKPLMMSIDRCPRVPERIKILDGVKRKNQNGDTMFLLECVDVDTEEPYQLWAFERDLTILGKEWGPKLTSWGYISFRKNLSGTRWVAYPAKDQHVESKF